MGSYNDAVVCELVGVFLLNKLSHIIDKHFVGLKRDDDLRVLRNYSDPTSERKRKEIVKVFEHFGFLIKI